jgi:hypothetical protein
MLLTVFFPEFIMAHAIFELAMAVESMSKMSKIQVVEPPFWYAALRRILKHLGTELNEIKPGDSRGLWRSLVDWLCDGNEEVRPVPKWSLTHCYFANMGGFYRFGTEELAQPLTAGDLVRSKSSTPYLHEEDIKDKGKTDLFAKGFALLQILSLVLSLIARQARHFAISQLEILTLAFAVCGVLTYAFYWYKPQGVGTPVEVTVEEPEKLLDRPTFDRLWDVLVDVPWAHGQRPKRIPNDNIPLQTTAVAVSLLAVLSTMFGSLHILAWNFEFPTAVEKVLWRTSALLSTFLPPLALVTIPLSQRVVAWGDPDDFVHDCLAIIREFAWHSDNTDRDTAYRARQRLEEIYIDPKDESSFRDVLGDETFARKLLHFITSEERRPPSDIELGAEFPEQFELLVQVIEGRTRRKQLADKAKPGIFPLKPLLPKSINSIIIYTTGIIYCLARVATIVLACSCLRAMPDSAYTTTWVTYAPTVQ